MSGKVEKGKTIYGYCSQHSFQSKNNGDHIFIYMFDIFGNAYFGMV